MNCGVYCVLIIVHISTTGNTKELVINWNFDVLSTGHIV